MTDPNPTLTAYQIAVAQTKLRFAFGLALGQFPLSSFIGMVSDEIEQLRQEGRTDTEVAEMIRTAGNIPISANDIFRNYASSETRGRKRMRRP